jgi:hypothetical protein
MQTLAGFWASFNPEKELAKEVVAPWGDIVGYQEGDPIELWTTSHRQSRQSMTSVASQTRQAETYPAAATADSRSFLFHAATSEVHNIGTRQNDNLFPPSTSFTKVQKGAYYSGIKIYNHLPRELKQLSNDQKSFELALKRFLYANSFYTLNEYFGHKCNPI